MKSVRNALRVLDELAVDGALGVGELARRTGIAKSTVQRCLETLADAGWIEVAFDGGPGAVTHWTIAERIRHRFTDGGADLVAAAEPVMRDLTAQSGEATHLVTLDGTDVVLRHRIAAAGPVQIVLPIGHAVPAYASATGKAILSTLALDERQARIPGRRTALTDATVTDAVAFDAELEAIAARGWATNLGEWHAHVAAVAAPVVVDGRAVGALSVSTTPERLAGERLDEVGALVVVAAAAVARRLGVVNSSAPTR
ncbi:MAG: IclR family transcriptional regulator [Actinomycetota bacterium]